MRFVLVVTWVGSFAGCLRDEDSPWWNEGREEQPYTWPGDDIVETSPAPPAISGGTLLIGRDGTAWASDPDRDLVWHVDLDEETVLAATALSPGDEPGRLIEDAAGRIHVALRGGGDLATIEPGFAQDVARRAVCGEPRGLAYDARLDQIHVACTSGELVTLPASGGAETRRLRMPESDLRDIVFDGDRMLVTTFRSAKVFTVSAEGDVVGAAQTPVEGSDGYDNAVAWRMVALPEGGAMMVHQKERNTMIPTGAGAYYATSPFDAVVHSTLAVFRTGEARAATPALASMDGPVESPVVGATLPVDVAVSTDGAFAVAAAGSNRIFVGAVATFESGAGYGYEATTGSLLVQDAQGNRLTPIAVAFDADGDIVVQTREGPGLMVFDGTNAVSSFVGERRADVALDARPVRDTGHETFHRAIEPSSLACASCHPEGREDGRVWSFDIGERRTQTVAGGLLRTTPFHWDGDLRGFRELMAEVFVGRMFAQPVSPATEASLASWLDQIPVPNAGVVADAETLARGRALFTDKCASCHEGDDLTNNQTVDVGTGGAFQVPSLVGIAARAPYMHHGRAATLRDRFDPAVGGEAHGFTRDMGEEDVDAMVAFLETL